MVHSKRGTFGGDEERGRSEAKRKEIGTENTVSKENSNERIKEKRKEMRTGE